MTDKEIGDLFEKDSLDAAPALIGKIISYDGRKIRITETEAYGNNDPFCYGVRYGRTENNSVSFCKGGKVFIYADMLMFTTGKECGKPQNVLIRQAEYSDGNKGKISGPGKLLAYLEPSKEKRKKLNGEWIGEEIKIENDATSVPGVKEGKRIGLAKNESVINNYIKHHCCLWNCPMDKKNEEYRAVVEKIVDIYAEIEWRFTKQK